MLPSRPSRRLLLSLAAVTVAGTAIVGGSSLASASSTASAATKSVAARVATAVVTLNDNVETDRVSEPAEETTLDGTTLDGTTLDHTTLDCPAIDTTAINDEQRELADYLTEQGIAFTIETTDGIDWVVPTGTDGATMNALDDYYWAKYPMPADVIEQINADTQRMVDYLREKGFDVAIITDRHGISTPDLADADQPLQDAINSCYTETFGGGGIVISIDGDMAVSTALPGGIETSDDLPAMIALPAPGDLPELTELPELSDLPGGEPTLIGCAFAGPVGGPVSGAMAVGTAGTVTVNASSAIVGVQPRK